MMSLKDEGAISQQALDNSQETLRIAEGEFERVNSIRSMTEIIAPFGGAVSIRQISLGEYIDPGDPIVRISQINPLNLIFNLPEQYVSNIKLNQDIKFKISDSNKEYIGRIIVIDPYIDPDTRSAKIKAIVQNPNKELLPGRFANVNIELTNHKNEISVPEEALIQEGNKKQVAIISKDNTIILKDVIVSKWSKDLVSISEGLMAGDVVITSGHQKIQSGSKVIQKPYTEIHNQILNKEITE